MKYERVYVEAIAYELAPVVITTAEIETRLAPVYKALHIPDGQLEALTSIYERRWWQPGFRVADGAIAAARKVLASSAVRPEDVGALVYSAVCREDFEPATACRCAHAVGVNSKAAVYDVANACLGAVNGMMDLANRIELGQIRAGLVIGSETAREINELTIDQLTAEPRIEVFTKSLATFTGGSGGAAVLLTDGSFSGGKGHRLLGGAQRTAPQHYGLCKWGLAELDNGPAMIPYASTDAAAVLKHGVELGKATWADLLGEMGWTVDDVDKIICHQVGGGHQEAILKALGVPREKDFPTYPFLGNIGTVSLPLTAGLADERGALEAGDRVGFLGIGSGLNCLMLGGGMVGGWLKELYPFDGHFFDRAGLRYHYLDEGKGDPVVMVHGNPTWSFYYRNLVSELRGGFRTIVPDHIGCGLSDKPGDDRYEYTLASRVADLEALLDHLGVRENITLVLHDWGGMIGMAYAVRHPERIKRLVVLNTAAFHLPETKRMPGTLSLARDSRFGAFLVRRLNAFCVGTAWIGCKRGLMPRLLRRAYCFPYDSPANRIAVLRFVQDIPLQPGDPAYAIVSEVQDNLSRFAETPTLICWGMRDFVFDRHFLKEWQRHLPKAEVHRFPRAGHYILEDAADEVVPLVRDFLSS